MSEDDKKFQDKRYTMFLNISEYYEIKFHWCTPSQPTAHICACFKCQECTENECTCFLEQRALAIKLPW